MTVETRELICEGRCNPGIGSLDLDIYEYRRHEVVDGGGRQPIADEGILARLRRLRLTVHYWVAPNRWRCISCESERVF